ncbi:MAG: hypothetical protein RLP09_09640 [Sandaracinaceae bacterium]
MTTKMKIQAVRFHKPVPAPISSEKIRSERAELTTKDVGEDGFSYGPHGIGYGVPKAGGGGDEKRYLVPWTEIRWCEYIVPAAEEAPEKPKKAPAKKGDAA